MGESSNDSNEIPNEARVDYDDTNWMLIDCPHDMLIVQPFDPEASEHQAFLQRNSGWYRKHFHVPSEYVLFDLSLSKSFSNINTRTQVGKFNDLDRDRRILSRHYSLLERKIDDEHTTQARIHVVSSSSR